MGKRLVGRRLLPLCLAAVFGGGVGAFGADIIVNEQDHAESSPVSTTGNIAITNTQGHSVVFGDDVQAGNVAVQGSAAFEKALTTTKLELHGNSDAEVSFSVNGGAVDAHRIYIGDAGKSFGGKATFHDAVTVDSFVDITGGTTVFKKSLTIGPANAASGPNGQYPLDDDYDLMITGGNNTFEDYVTAGSLSTVDNYSTNVFKKHVQLWGTDVEIGLNSSLNLLNGKTTFEDGVMISAPDSSYTGDVHSIVLNADVDFRNHVISNRKSYLHIGYDEDFLKTGNGDFAQFANAKTKVTFEGASSGEFISGIGRTFISKGATVEAKSDIRYNGMLYIRDDATYTAHGKTTAYGIEIGKEDAPVFTPGSGRFTGSASFKEVFAHASLDIHGNGRTIFDGAVTVGDESLGVRPDYDCYLGIMGGTVTFNGTVTAGSLGIDEFLLATADSQKIVVATEFNEAVRLWGTDPDITSHSLFIAGGANTFKKSVDTGGSNAFIANTTTVFADTLDAGAGKIQMGFIEPVLDSFIIPNSGFTSTEKEYLRNQTTEVILNSNASTLKASEVHVSQGATLSVLAHAKIDGDARFDNGGELVIGAAGGNGEYSLDVTGGLTIDNARAAVLGLDLSKEKDFVVLTAGSIDGAFDTSGRSLFRLRTENNTIVTDGLNSVKDIIATFPDVADSSNSMRSAGLIDSILQSSASSQVLQVNLGDGVTKAVAIAEKDGELGKVAFSQLFGEHGLAGADASQATARNFSNSIMNHQIQLRDYSQASAQSATSSTAFASLRPTRQGYSSSFNPNRIWGGGFGAWTRQDDRDNQFGYKYNSGGFILGYDRQLGDLVVGVSAAYSNGDIKNNEGFTKTDVDTFNAGLYASYNHCSGLFVDANVGLGYAWNETKTNDVINGGKKEGKYRNTSFQAGATLGYAFTLPQELRIIPSVGLQYTHVHQKGWSEKVQSANQIANWYDKANNDYLSVPLQLRLNKTFCLGADTTITPEIRGAWIYEAKDPKARVRMGYVGSGNSTTLFGVDSGRSRGLVGAGIKAKLNRKVDVFADYNYEFRSGYKNHNVMAGLGLSF